tara:strand:+ start:98 stop:280 length:183 start_codon:yes stop_codon:yes gene_type:complete
MPIDPHDTSTWPTRTKIAAVLIEKAMRMPESQWEQADKVLEDARILEREAKRDGDLIVPF